jgi:hypothetical protein
LAWLTPACAAWAVDAAECELAAEACDAAEDECEDAPGEDLSWWPSALPCGDWLAWPLGALP